MHQFLKFILERKSTCFGQFLCPLSGVFFTELTALVYVIQVCWQLASRIRMELEFHPDPAHKPSANLYDIHHCRVYSEKLLMMDRGTVRNM